MCFSFWDSIIAENSKLYHFFSVQHLDKRKKSRLYGHSQIHVLHSPVYNIIQERKLQYGNFIQNSRNPLVIAHLNSHIFERNINKRKDGTGSTWFLSHSCHRSKFSWSFLVIQRYLRSVTKSGSTYVLLYCWSNLICNNRFLFTLWKGVVSVVLAYKASGYVLLTVLQPVLFCICAKVSLPSSCNGNIRWNRNKLWLPLNCVKAITTYTQWQKIC